MTIRCLRRQPARPIRRATRARLLDVEAVEQTQARLRISAVGEIDADNAKWFADHVCALVRGRVELTLDLSGLDFFALDGCTALHAVNAHVMRMGAAWSVIPSPAVSRVLQLCDPAGLIPVAESERLAEPA